MNAYALAYEHFRCSHYGIAWHFYAPLCAVELTFILFGGCIVYMLLPAFFSRGKYELSEDFMWERLAEDVYATALFPLLFPFAPLWMRGGQKQDAEREIQAFHAKRARQKA